MYKELVNDFLPFAKKQLDQENAQNPMGYTAHYDPSSMVVTIYTTGRHPKDILRSLSHELVHHSQNCRGEDLMVKTHDIDADPNLKAMEDPMSKASKEAEEPKEETQTESKDYHDKKNSMLHNMLLRKFGIKKGE